MRSGKCTPFSNKVTQKNQKQNKKIPLQKIYFFKIYFLKSERSFLVIFTYERNDPTYTTVLKFKI